MVAATSWSLEKRRPNREPYFSDVTMNSSIRFQNEDELILTNVSTYSEGKYRCIREPGAQCVAGCIFVQGNAMLCCTVLHSLGRDIRFLLLKPKEIFHIAWIIAAMQYKTSYLQAISCCLMY